MVPLHKHPDLRRLLEELVLLREHNKQFQRPHPTMLLFAEASVSLVALERILRLAVPNAGQQTLHPLLTQGIKQRLFKLPWDDDKQEDAIRMVCNVRNTLQHGNYEQAAQQANKSFEDYFRHDFAGEVEAIGRLVFNLVEQLDPNFNEGIQEIYGMPDNLALPHAEDFSHK
jgi:hypothetical protein